MADEGEGESHFMLTSTFQELTGADADAAAHVLEAHDWDLNNAVEFFFTHGPPRQAPLRADSAPDGDEAFARALAGADRAGPPPEIRGIGAGPEGGVGPGPLPDFPVYHNQLDASDDFNRDEDEPIVVDESPVLAAPAPMVPPAPDIPDLPDGINLEEARMLEAAMLGTVYTGRMPDFSNLPPEVPADPAVMEQRLLREEQDAAYHASLAADRERAAAEELARREAKKVAAREAEEKVLEQRRKEEEERSYQMWIEDKREALGMEPEGGKGVIQLQVRMPDGARLARRFSVSDPMARVFDFVDVSMAEQTGDGPPAMKPGAYTLGTQFPRRVFTPDQEGTLDSHGLNHKQEALFLQMKQ
eukprot:jgi/Tetstr1/442813/TSEL_030897.t1